MLLLWDRGFHSCEMIAAVLSSGGTRPRAAACDRQARTRAHPPRRHPDRAATPGGPKDAARGDGGAGAADRLYDRRPRSSGARHRAPARHHPARPRTSPGGGTGGLLLFLAFARPLRETLRVYERWEFELGVDELKTHQRTPKLPLRSKRPVGVIQEVYGLLLAHYVVRAVMLDAARTADLPPDRLSFTTALHVIREAVPEFVRTHRSHHPRIYAQVLADIAAVPLPNRANRAYPRVVKKKMSSYDVKKPCHIHPPQPTKPFSRSIAILK